MLVIVVLVVPFVGVVVYARLRFARVPRVRSNVRASTRPYTHVYPPFEEGDPRRRR